MAMGVVVSLDPATVIRIIAPPDRAREKLRCRARPWAFGSVKKIADGAQHRAAPVGMQGVMLAPIALVREKCASVAQKIERAFPRRIQRSARAAMASLCMPKVSSMPTSRPGLTHGRLSIADQRRRLAARHLVSPAPERGIFIAQTSRAARDKSGTKGRGLVDPALAGWPTLAPLLLPQSPDRAGQAKFAAHRLAHHAGKVAAGTAAKVRGILG